MENLTQKVKSAFLDNRRKLGRVAMISAIVAYDLIGASPLLAAPSYQDQDPTTGITTTEPISTTNSTSEDEGVGCCPPGQASLFFDPDEVSDSSCKPLYEADTLLCNTGEVPSPVMLTYNIFKEGEDNDLSFTLTPDSINQLGPGECVNIHSALEVGIQELMQGEEVKVRVEACTQNPCSPQKCSTLTFTATGHCLPTDIDLLENSFKAYSPAQSSPLQSPVNAGKLMLLGLGIVGATGYATQRFRKKSE